MFKNNCIFYRRQAECAFVGGRKFSQLIRDAASKYGAGIHEVTLETQYRCMGSNDYLLWIESVLGYTEEERIFRKDDQFDFRIFSSPQEIMDILNEKEKEKPNSARMTSRILLAMEQ